jgi:hypothetical protein
MHLLLHPDWSAASCCPEELLACVLYAELVFLYICMNININKMMTRVSTSARATLEQPGSYTVSSVRAADCVGTLSHVPAAGVHNKCVLYTRS